MRTKLIVLFLAAAPAALAAQHQPLPSDTLRTLPELTPPSLLPQTSSRAGDAVAGAVEGAVAGATYGAILSQTAPECAPAGSARRSAASGAVFGALWGGLRGLLGLRGRRGPVVTDVPDRTRQPAPSLPPVADSSCRGAASGAPPFSR